MKKTLLCLSALALPFLSNGQSDHFEQLGSKLPTPNVYRTGSGAPGEQYWQQQADYKITAELDDKNQKLSGFETITYTNNSPHSLTYLWLQLDENVRREDSDTYASETSSIHSKMTGRSLRDIIGHGEDMGLHIMEVKDANGNILPFTINKTMMRLDLPKALKTNEQFTFSVKWWYNIPSREKHGSRGGYEFFEEDKNYLYTMTAWYPRMCVYDDVNGWQNKQFLGYGEYALTFGDYEVNITVPSDHVVPATGELQNSKEILSTKQIERYEEAKSSKEKVMIITKKEAAKNEKSKPKGTKTWRYKAQNVRDFAWGSSRKFLWDAKGVDLNGKQVMAMSFYSKESDNFFGRYSTPAIENTLKVYSKHTLDYPYPVAISVEGDNGMEYPMICFNYGRPEKDGTYSEAYKYRMISVIIHEVGHNFFPMIINSDERQWAWMDEGVNTFVQFLAEQEWDVNYPSRRGPAHKIVDYMGGDKANMSPIMTSSDNIKQYFNNAYGKTATALNILRETVMGRELFDYAFKEYARRWAFKHPKPQDFFRTMEDASGVDLDWFWRGWFYTTDNVDISVENMKWFKLDTKKPAEVQKRDKERSEKYHASLSKERNLNNNTYMKRHPELRDFYDKKGGYERYAVRKENHKDYETFRSSLNKEDKELLDKDYNFYELEFKNIGGIVMPLILEFNFVDGTSDVVKIPAEIWRKNEKSVKKVFAYKKEVTDVVLDPYREIADVDESNNLFPRAYKPSRFEIYKYNRKKPENGMQKHGN